MNKLIFSAIAAVGLTAFGEYGKIELTGNQGVGVGAAKVEAVSVVSTDSDAAVSVYDVRSVQSFTNVTDVVSTTVTNIVLTPSRIGVYSSGPFVYTNSTDTTYVLKGGSDSLSWTNVTNDYYRFVYVDSSASYTNVVQGTNTVFIGGKGFDYTYIPQIPTVTTNIVTTAITNIVPVLKETAYVTNTIADVTCVGGKAIAIPTNIFICAGDKIVTTGLDVEGEKVEARLIFTK